MTYARELLPKKTFVLTFTFSWDEVKKEYDKVVMDAAKTAELPGFRKGKAPLDLVKKNLDKNKIYEEIIRSLLPAAYSEALQKENLKPVAAPKIEIVSVEENRDWVFKATSAEAPDVDLKDYKKEVSGVLAKGKIWVPGQDKDKKEGEDKNKKLSEILDLLLKYVMVELADILVEEETNRLLAQALDEIKKLGLTLDQYLSSTRKTALDLRHEYQKKAMASLKLEFILTKIAETENIMVEESDWQKALNEVKEEKEKQILEQNRYQLAGVLRRQKTLDFLTSL